MSQEISKNYFEGNAWELPGDFDLISKANNELESRLINLGWNNSNSIDYEDPVPAMVDGFSDALDNAMVHGSYGLKEREEGESWRSAIKRLGLTTNKKIKVILDLSASEVKIVVQDEGEGFDPDIDIVPDPTAPENILKGSGRGLLFLRSAYDEIKFDKNNKSVTLIKRKKP